MLLADYGLYTADVSEALQVAADIALEKKTYRIPLEPGLLFGLRFVLLSAESATSGTQAREMALAVRISYPAPALPSAVQPAEDKADMDQGEDRESKAETEPDTPLEAIQSYTHTRMLPPGQLYFEGLRIADTALFVPGTYTFELLLDGKAQLTRDFELYREAPAPQKQ